MSHVNSVSNKQKTIHRFIEPTIHQLSKAFYTSIIFAKSLNLGANKAPKFKDLANLADSANIDRTFS